MATVVVDAVLGTGDQRSGQRRDAGRHPARSTTAFRWRKVVAVDIPSGMPSDGGDPTGEQARADYTVTFTAPKPAHALAPNCDAIGEWRVGPIGSPPQLYDADDSIWLSLVRAGDVRATCLQPRPRAGHKGSLRPCAGGRGIARQDRSGRHVWHGCFARGRRIGDRGFRGVRYSGDRRPRSGTDDRTADHRPFARYGGQGFAKEGRDRHRARTGNGRRNGGYGPARVRRIPQPMVVDADALECARRRGMVWRR